MKIVGRGRYSRTREQLIEELSEAISKKVKKQEKQEIYTVLKTNYSFHLYNLPHLKLELLLQLEIGLLFIIEFDLCNSVLYSENWFVVEQMLCVCVESVTIDNSPAISLRFFTTNKLTNALKCSG